MNDDVQDLRNHIYDLKVEIEGYRQQIRIAKNNIENWQQQLDNTISEHNDCIEELKQKMHNPYGGPSC